MSEEQTELIELRRKVAKLEKKLSTQHDAATNSVSINNQPKIPSPPSILKPSASSTFLHPISRSTSPVSFAPPHQLVHGASDLSKKLNPPKTHVAGTGTFYFDDDDSILAAGHAQAKVGRVYPPNHQKSEHHCSSDENDFPNENVNVFDFPMETSLDSSLDSSNDSSSIDVTVAVQPSPIPIPIPTPTPTPNFPVTPPKTPAGVNRTKPPGQDEPDKTTSDIFSPHNISQGACLEKFGYAPGEIVNKVRSAQNTSRLLHIPKSNRLLQLFSEHVISEHEDRLIRYLLARDDKNTLACLIWIESNGITKKTIEKFRNDLKFNLNNFKNSPQKEGHSGLFFNSGDDDSNEEPVRPDTAMDLSYTSEDMNKENELHMTVDDVNRDIDNFQNRNSNSNSNSNNNNNNNNNSSNNNSNNNNNNNNPPSSIPQTIPFQNLIHKVLVKIATRLRELGPSTRQKVILVGSGVYNPLHRLHLRMFYLARQFLEGHSHFEVLGGIVSPSHSTAVRQKFRQKPKEIIPPKHRLAMARLSVGDR